jgi:hypothetical protein
MYRHLGKKRMHAIHSRSTRTSNLRGDIPYATGNVMSVRQEPGAGGEQLRLLPHKARHQTQKSLYLVFYPLADQDASETRKSKN